MNNILDQAEALASGGNVGSAVTLLQGAERTGNADAARQLAVWCLTGRWFRRNLASSRALFARAAALGDVQASAIYRAFVANGTGGQADWPSAMALLRSVSAHDPAAAEQRSLITAMNLSDTGEPRSDFKPVALSDEAEVVSFPSFFSAAECAYLIAAAEPLLERNVVVDPRSGRLVPNPVRTSRGASFPFVDENPAIHALNRRIAAATGTDVRAGEPLQVLRYEPGEEYRSHLDALPGVPPAQQRVLTFLIYLNADFEGGVTDFPKLRVRFKGKTGDGLMFRNAGADGQTDDRLIHAGLPVERGVKHLASRWIRAAPLDLG